MAKEKKEKDKSLGGTVFKVLKKTFPKKLKSKDIIKSSPRATIVENQPVYTQDKSRFFKDEWDEEKRQLFFK